MERLPDEMWLEIFQRVDEDYRITLPFVCKKWRGLVAELIRNTQNPFITIPALNRIAKDDNFGMILWLDSIGVNVVTSNTIYSFAKHGNIKAVKWMISKISFMGSPKLDYALAKYNLRERHELFYDLSICDSTVVFR